MMNNMQLQIIGSLEGIEDIRPIWEKIQAQETYPKINADIDRYLTIIKTTGEEIQPYILLIKQNNNIASMLIGSIKKTPIRCKVGRNTILKPSLRVLSIVYGGVLGNPSEGVCRFLIGELIKLLRNGELDVVYFNYLETNSLIYKVVRNMPGILSRGYFPKIESHVSMAIPRDFDHFMQSCSKNRRKHIRKYINRLEKEYPEKVTLSMCSKQEEVEHAIETISRISGRTYQRAFGGGLVNDEQTRILWNNAAKNGWLRVYILHINNEPCAFRYGLKYRGTYFGELIGYLPEWKEYNVGTVLFTKFLEQICQEPDIERIDFGFGGGFHKELGDSFSWAEAPAYIFAPRFFPIFVNLVFSLSRGITLFIQYCITKLGVFNSVQQFRRRIVLHKNRNKKRE
jgi:hypothetical protein